MRLPALEFSIGSDLKRDLAIASADPAFKFTPLSGPERDRLNQFTNVRRRLDWLRGRNAMKQLLAMLGRDTDTSQVEFPHRQFSLTHAGENAFSIADISGSAGIGIDYEPFRNVNPEITRLFLNSTELRWLESCPETEVQHQIVRFWTIKEAAFKSYPSNAGLVLADFSIAEPGSRISDVTVAHGALGICVACERYDEGYLSVAICEELPS
jgi:4'-phosphopantetheinyl transferase EntD